jgi:hypothetical protein
VPKSALPDIVQAILSPDTRASYRARWSMLIAVSDMLPEHYAVEQTVVNAEGEPLGDMLLAPLRSVPADRLRDSLADPEMARAFGAWRAAVTALEARNARRLLVLGDGARWLQRLRPTIATDGLPTLDALLAEIEQWLRGRWRVAAPLEGDLRAWSTRLARRYDLCPKHWRLA